MKALKIVVHGKVHGVYFRQSSMEMATSLQINGTVRNCEDGTVEIFAEGNEEDIINFVEWCHVGPKSAIVERVDIHDIPLKNINSFTITY